MLNKTFTPFPILVTERLMLRQLSETDRHEIFALRSNIHINKYLDRQPSATIDDAKDFIDRINGFIKNEVSVYWAITIAANEKVIGTICLFDFSNEKEKCEIGYELSPEHQGKGIMKEAMERVLRYGFETIGLKRIEAFTHKENANSTKLLDKFHFIRSNAPDPADKDFYLFSLTV